MLENNQIKMMNFKRLLCLILFICFNVYYANAEQEQIDQEVEKRKIFRRELGVYNFTGPDYSAMFAIIAGVSLTLIFAIIYITTGLLSMEPAKDSIIYRMTTTRPKRD